MKYKAILFDLDGTIIHTEEFWQQATLQLMNKNPNACPIIKKELAGKLIGRALHDSCRLIKDTLELSESVEELILEKESRALDLYKNRVSFLKGFEDFFIHATKDHGLKTAIATNSTLKTLDAANVEAKLHTFFDDRMYSFEHVDKKAKPNPDLFLYAAEKLQIDPRECLVIEDSITGVQAAKAAEMFCVRILAKDNPNQKSLADMTVSEYGEIDLYKIISDIK
jgi:HAD superfamily hydrolase (TIGR01509 family)